MCPSLDEKPSDWRNNFSVFGNETTRRDFIKGSIAAGAVVGGGLGAFYFGYSSTLASPVRVGVIGTGDQGGVLIGAINPNFIRVRSIADLRTYNQWRALHGDSYEGEREPRPGLMAKYGWKTEDAARRKVRVCDTYQELLENAKQDGLEAVIIALPLHLHAEVAVAAMKAGLHVFTEKMMADTTYKCKEMARAAKKANKCLAVGHQRHYNLLYANAAEAIASGLLGDLHYVRAQCHVDDLNLPPLPGSKDLAKLAADWEKKAKAAGGPEIDAWRKRLLQIAEQKTDDVFDGAGYGQKPGPGPVEELVRWRFYDRTSQGLFAEVASQQADAAAMFVAAAHGGKTQYPLSIVASANRPFKAAAAGDVADHATCILEYPAPGYDPKDTNDAARKRIGVQCAVVSGNGYGGYGEIAYGTKMAIILEQEKEWTPVQESGAKSSVKAAAGGGATLDTQASAAVSAGAKAGIASRGYAEELEHWAWCIRHRASENQPRGSAEVGLANAVVALAAKASAQQGKTVVFDEKWFDVQSDATLEGEKPDLKRYDS